MGRRNPLNLRWNLENPLRANQYRALQAMSPTGRLVSLEEVSAWCEATIPHLRARYEDKADNPGAIWRILIGWWSRTDDREIARAVARIERLTDTARCEEIRKASEQEGDPLAHVTDPGLRDLLGLDS